MEISFLKYEYLSYEKNLPTFHYVYWMAYKNPHMLGSVIPYKTETTSFFFVCSLDLLIVVEGFSSFFRTGSLRDHSGIDVAIPQVFHEKKCI